MGGLFQKAKGAVLNIKNHWKHPADGRYVSYKEIAAYSIGGVGVHFIAAMVGQVGLTVNCLLIASVYGLNPVLLGILSSVMTAVTLVVIPIRGAVMDNNRSKKGKYRPLILYTAIPTALLVVAMGYIPMDSGETLKFALVGIGTIILGVMNAQFFVLGYNNLAQVMTPNTDERAVIYTVSSVAYSLAPTITGFVIPLVANSFVGGLTNIMTYRIVMPIFAAIGLVLSFIAYAGTKERIVVAKDYVAKVKFMDGLKKVFINKYFWIKNVSELFNFAKLGLMFLLNWMYVYHLQNNYIMSFVGLVIGTASLVGMLISPILIKKFGKRKVVIITNFIFAISSVCIAIFPGVPAAFFIFFYLSSMTTAVQMITTPTVRADILDYQQWKTGDRVEGFSENFGILTNLIGLGTALIIPFIIQRMGLVNNYDMLYDPEVRLPLFRIIAIIAAVGGIATAIPYFFYDLTEDKHRQMIADLKQRALERDNELGLEQTAEDLERELIG